MRGAKREARHDHYDSIALNVIGRRKYEQNKNNLLAVDWK